MRSAPAASRARTIGVGYSLPMRRLFACCLAVVLSSVLLHGQSADRTITIFHFNDVYEITPVDAGAAGGLARVANLRARMKARTPAMITTLGGDYLSPSAIGTARVDGERLNGRQMVAVLNVVGVDWATLGNHEFDIPEATFRARLAESKFKLVSSNVTDASGAPFPGIVPHAVVPLKTPGGTVRVGLLGLTIDANKQPWVRYAPPIEAARQAVAQLKGKCDVIVALTHLALDGDREIAEEVPEIDLILGGHEHENWMIERGPGYTPIVKADANVRTVAIVTIHVPSPGRRRAGATTAAARPVITARLERIDATIPEGPRTGAEVRKWRDLAFAGFRASGFDPNEVVAVIPEPLEAREAIVRNRATGMTSLILDAMNHEAGTTMAIFNSGSIRLDDVVRGGPVTQYDVIRVLPFGGPVVKITMTGTLLARVLDIGAQNKGTGGYLQVTGIPATIEPAGRYTLAITDFLLTGGEANLGFLTRTSADISNITDLRDIRMAVIDELKKRSPRQDQLHNAAIPQLPMNAQLSTPKTPNPGPEAAARLASYLGSFWQLRLGY
jgi:5'-nucleotidase / UDP-sugar diphosphatase